MLIVTVMNPQLQMVPLLQTTKRLWWSGNMMKDDYGSDDEEELFIKETPHNYGSDDHEPRDITVASTDEINTVSKEVSGLTAEIRVAANANQEPSSSVTKRLASTNPILDPNKNAQNRARRA
ncbi:hypothetical protein F2Q68_00027297 [Brassica cretica]|uniref:Uncharacterized protein n=1 Tax=Brassica cretica TaxID=69181 RepID=A0A8S9IFZ5_BRACR|nr:hypothetical protein F2Q68_00027297 [Brassica cretica]